MPRVTFDTRGATVGAASRQKGINKARVPISIWPPVRTDKIFAFGDHLAHGVPGETRGSPLDLLQPVTPRIPSRFHLTYHDFHSIVRVTRID